MTQREQLLAIADQLPTTPEELSWTTEPPPSYRWTWTVFHELTRTYTERGIPLRISNQEILAWATLNNERLSRRQLVALRGMDIAWINTRMELERQRNG